MTESFVALAESVVPGCAKTWKGATEDEVDEIEFFAAQDLPPFYRWFLETMGEDMGLLGHAYLDLRAKTVLAAYNTFEVRRGEGPLYIGRHPEPAFPFRQFLDLDAPCREDAAVLEEPEAGGDRTRAFETLREQLAWGLLVRCRLATAPQQFIGAASSPGGDVVDALQPALATLGWNSMLDTGRYCGLYERGQELLLLSNRVDPKRHETLVVQAGAADAVTLRAALGELAVTADVKVEALRWEPPLPDAG
ncbi:MAG: hypothetical protein ACRBN8_25085 [Nannocystales bacterium]